MSAPADILCLDLGSTFTKGARFAVADREVRVRGRAMAPTDRGDLTRGAARVVASLLGRPESAGWTEHSEIPLYATSSARGGLSILAVGIVPELTLKAASLAAVSAGGRIAGHCAYGLTDEDLLRLEQDPPDIVLLTGGTDGGNEEWNRRNAGRLAESAYDGFILFAGNARQHNEMRRLLGHKRLQITENLMPEIDRLHIEPCRSAIRRLFMDRIVLGKGLGEIAARCRAPVTPTPAAVLRLVETLAQGGEWRQTMLVDIGGATTDVYSATPPGSVEPGVVVKGLPEPDVKRTVEGDLGMRLNAAAVAALPGTFEPGGLSGREIEAYVSRCTADTTALPRTGVERRIERALAEQCIRTALQRHAGTRREVATAAGSVQVQHGKDLRGIRRLVGSGGVLAALQDEQTVRAAWDGALLNDAARVLLPRSVEIRFDAGYDLPLAAALTRYDAVAAAVFFQSRIQQPVVEVPA